MPRGSQKNQLLRELDIARDLCTQGVLFEACCINRKEEKKEKTTP